MSKSRKFLLIVFATIVLPMVAYVVYEVSNLNENEKIIEEVYESQLESLIFSVNQYSNDFMSALLNKVEQDFDTKTFTVGMETLDLIEHDGFQVFSISPANQDYFYYLNTTGMEVEEALKELKNKKGKLIKQLIGFYDSGYRKLEPSGMFEFEGSTYQVLMAIVKVDFDYYVCIGLIDPLYFIEEVLSPKMQQIGGEEMIITLQNQGASDLVFTTDTLKNKILVTRKMWLFPELLMGVSPKSETYASLVSDRLRNNIIAIGLLIVLLGAGFTLVIRNVNREMRLAQTKSEFVSNVSHELRTPLALISMFAETLLLGRIKSKEKETEYTEIIFKETNRLTGIVNRILNFSKIEANKKTYHFGAVNINELLQEVNRDYSYHLEQNGFAHGLDQSDEELIINGDKEAIYEAVVNLIDNAMKYSSENKEVQLISGRKGENVWIKVKDKGVGIPKERLPYIFDKFYRVSENNIYTTKGTGLGLTIIKHIMDAHHGTINVESESGKGSTFALVFNSNFENG